MPDQSLSRKSASVPSWSTITYLASAECETCHASFPQPDADAVDRARRWAKEHSRRNPACRVRVEIGKTTVYGESSPGVLD